MSTLRALVVAAVLTLAPLAFAQDPDKALEYYALSQKFTAALGSSNWSEAEDAGRKALAISEVDGDIWFGFATALMRQQKFEQAMEPLKKALEKGAFVNKFEATASFSLASCNAHLGRMDEALAWLRLAFDKGYRDIRMFRNREFAPLKGNRQYDDMAADRDVTGLSRNEGLAYDLWFMDRELRRIHFDPYGVASKDALDSEYEAIKTAIPTITDEEFYARARKYVAMVGDGHTSLRVNTWDEPDVRVIPLRFVKFTDGIFVTAATEEYKHLIQMKLMSVNGRTVDELWSLLAPLISRDNTYDDVAGVPALMGSVAALKGLGLAHGDKATLALLDKEGRVTRVDLPFVSSQAITLTDPVQTMPTRAHYIKNPRKVYWYEYIPEEKTLYMQYNAVRQDQDESMAAFMDRLFKEIADKLVDKFVIDVRFNGGGNSFFNSGIQYPVMRNEKINQQGKLFIITGRNTFSAAQNFTTDFMRDSNAIFVGEPTGSRPNFVGETIPVVLPYTGMRMSVSDLYWQRSWPMDHRQWIPPDIPTEMSSGHYFAGRDPAMEAIFAYGKG